MEHERIQENPDLPPESDIEEGDEFDSAVTSRIAPELVEAQSLNAARRSGHHSVFTNLAVAPKPQSEQGDRVLEPGDRLKQRFEIVELVHSSGMGHVYKALDHRRDRDGFGQVHVAIKMMRRDVASQREVRLALEREAATAQRLSHPNVINIFDFDEHDGQFFLVMEWLDGESVNTLLRRTSGHGLPPETAMPIIEGAAAAIQHAHSHDVVHADINPSNVFITTSGEIKLLDFGVARSTGKAESQDALAWTTQTYASPEVLSGETPVFADDVFSFGCVVYRLLSGAHPYDGLVSTEAENEGLRPDRPPGIDDDDWRSLARALSLARADRPASVESLVPRPAPAPSTVVDQRDYLPLPDSSWKFVAAIAALLVTVATFVFWPEQAELEQPVAAVVEPSPSDALIADAERAMLEQRYVLPDQNNARQIFREVLDIDPGNADALNGIRLISDEYVRRADLALRDGDPAASAVALAIAEETDPTNPSIALVSNMLEAESNRWLKEAEEAAEFGDDIRVEQLILQTEQFGIVEEGRINEVRETILQNALEREFLDRLAAADAFVAAGQLIQPESANAHSILIDLNQERRGDARLLASMENLGRRLLTRAAFSTASGELVQAAELLDAADTLGVLATEVDDARASLLAATRRSMAMEAAASQKQSTPPPAIDRAPTQPARQTVSSGPASSESKPEPIFSLPSQVEATAAPPRRMTLGELGIEKFVQPVFPRSARRRGESGFVDIEFLVQPDGTATQIRVLHGEPAGVFDASAEKAVRKWRFTPRLESVTARVTLSFQSEQ